VAAVLKEKERRRAADERLRAEKERATRPAPESETRADATPGEGARRKRVRPGERA
jgi:hypothetical protein